LKHKKSINIKPVIFAFGILLLTGCSFNPVISIPSPVVSDGTVYFYTMCHFNAVEEKTGVVKWNIETANLEKSDACQENESDAITHLINRTSQLLPTQEPPGHI